MRSNLVFSRRSRQEGATLVIALLVLVLIMMIGITAVSVSNTQYKLAGNLQFEDGAMNNAETAVSVAENWLSTGTNYKNAGFTTYDSINTPQLYPLGASNDPLAITWSDANSIIVGSNWQRYQIQLLSTSNQLMGSNAAAGRQASGVCNKVNTYLVTGRGQTNRGATKLVQSFYSVLSC